MIVTVASGKGGTGKTTVAVSLALTAADLQQNDSEDGPRSGVAFLDGDVEEPNAGLFLKPVIDSRREVGLLVPDIDADRCNHCGRCAKVCAYHAIAVLGQKTIVFSHLCHGCGSCSLNCPQQAIREKLHVTGVVEEGHANGIAFAQGIMNVGEAMAVPIIRELKKSSDGIILADFTVRDAPPGTSCPVVECLRGSDYALMVTEPTPFGLHDLKLAIEVAQDELGLPTGVVINRDGIGDTGVEQYCHSQSIPIMMRLPFDRRIAEVSSEGLPLVSALPEYRPQFAALFRQIREGIAR